MNKVVVLISIGIISVLVACQKQTQARQSLRWDSLDTPNSRAMARENSGWGDDVDTTLVMDSLWVIEANAAAGNPQLFPIQDTATFSDTIVAPVDTATAVQKVHPLATAGFMISLAGLSITLITPIVCVLGVIFCSIAISKINRNPQKFKGKRLATWGLILSAVGLLISFIGVFVMGL